MGQGPYAEPVRLRQLDVALSRRFGFQTLERGKTTALNERLEPLLRQIERITNDRDLELFARSLLKSDARLLLESLVVLADPPDLGARIAYIVGIALPRGFFRKAPPLMRLLLMHPVGRVAAGFYREHAAQDTPAFWRSLAHAGAQQSFQDLDALFQKEGRWTTYCEKYRLPAKPQAGAMRALAKAYLTTKSSALIAVRQEWEIDQAFIALRQEDWPEAVSTFFSQVEPSRNKKIVVRVVAELGRPDSPKDDRWDRVRDDVRSAVQKLLAEMELQNFFASDPGNERFRFWRRYLNRMTRVVPKLDGEAIIISFGRFGVVEFKHTGNASYFYRQDALEELIRKQVSSPSGLKRRDWAGYIDKLSHTRNWQETFDYVLRQIWQAYG